MTKNSNLLKAKNIKNDEFYTKIEDIKNELYHYKNYFKNKVVLCNCDNPELSAFWKYFHLNFKNFGLKQLISTYYEIDKSTYKMVYNGGNDLDITVGIKTRLTGNGDFRNQECIDILDKSDIVVTNPPFSLAREFISCLIQHNKQFLIVGNLNWITYKEVFPLFKDNKIWLGYRKLNKDMYFNLPDEQKEWLVNNKKEGSAYKIVDGVVMGRLASACWFTNIEHKKRHECINTSYSYKTNSELYTKYDNYNIINVDKVKQIPMDYDGIMGVPITYIERHNPEQFEIIGIANNIRWIGYECYTIINGNKIYNRLLIRKKMEK